MRSKLKIWMAASAGAGLLFAGCGREDTNRLGNFQNLSGFRVIFTDPGYNAEMVPLDSQIRVQFSEPIDQASVTGSVKVTETIGQDVKDITQEGSLSIQNSSMLIFAPSRQFVRDAMYQMTIFTGLRSLTGNSLLYQTLVPFYTGLRSDSTGFGVISVAGPPQVVSLDVYQGSGVCLAFTVEFNEDLSSVPTAKMDVRAGVPFVGNGFVTRTELLYAAPIYPDNYRQFWLVPGNLGCSQDMCDAGTELEVKVTNAIDRSGERLLDNASSDEQFKTPGDYLCM
ncbi:MAG TPA: Ig-like domain-containing protein [Bdellovibrionota bacterium]|nr:Ig-like domain-containing protein [Bdellovibrionota bacterium]